MLHILFTLGLLIDNSFDSAQILGIGLTGMSKFALQRQSGALIYSLPSLSYNTNPNSVETFSVHLGRHDQPVGLAVSLSPALGSVLTKVALVRVVRPIHAPGPILSDKDVKVDAEDEKEEQAIEEPSFIRKYWWVIVGAMLLSSFFGPAEAGRPNQGAGSK